MGGRTLKVSSSKPEGALQSRVTNQIKSLKRLNVAV